MRLLEWLALALAMISVLSGAWTLIQTRGIRDPKAKATRFQVCGMSLMVAYVPADMVVEHIGKDALFFIPFGVAVLGMIVIAIGFHMQKSGPIR